MEERGPDVGDGIRVEALTTRGAVRGNKGVLVIKGTRGWASTLTIETSQIMTEGAKGLLTVVWDHALSQEQNNCSPTVVVKQWKQKGVHPDEVRNVYDGDAAWQALVNGGSKLAEET